MGSLSIFWKLPYTSITNIDFLTEDVIQLPSNAKITFSQESATDPQERYLAPGLLMCFWSKTQISYRTAVNKVLLIIFHEENTKKLVNTMLLLTVLDVHTRKYLF